MVILYRKTVLNAFLKRVGIKIKLESKLKIPPQITQILDLKYLVHNHAAPNQMLKYLLLYFFVQN